MRRIWMSGALALLLLGLACESDKPTDAGEQTISLVAEANASVPEVSIWDVVFDGQVVDHACEVTGRLRPVLIPWRYSAELSVIRPGETTEEVIATSVGTTDEFSSVTPYDDTIFGTPGDRDMGQVRWTNGRTVTKASRDFFENCEGRVLEDSNILGEPERFDVPAPQGTTVVFRARKQPESDASPFEIHLVTAPTLSAFTFVDGVEVTPQGESISTGEDGSGFTMSLRIR